MRASRRVLGIAAGAALLASAALAPAAHGSPAHHDPLRSVVTAITPVHQKPAATTTLKVVDNIKWGSDSSEKLDMYRPKNPLLLPQVIMVHGGGWDEGTRTQLAGESKTIAGWGYVVYNIDYRLDTPTLPGNPLEPNEVKKAIGWVIGHSVTFGGLSNKIALMGGSSAAQVVELAAEQINKMQPKTVLGVVGLSGLVNFEEVMATILTGTSGIGQDQIQATQDMLGCHNSVYDCTTAEEDSASPVFGIDSATCPAFMITNGTDEEVPLDQPEEMVADLKQAGCASYFVTPNTDLHGFKYWNLIVNQVKGFLAAAL